MALIRPRHWKHMARAAILALAAGVMPLSAQESDAPGADAGAPQDFAPEPDAQSGMQIGRAHV